MRIENFTSKLSVGSDGDDGTADNVSVSPLTKVALFTKSDPDVAAPEIVTDTAVSAPFFRTKNV
jgi:hypothetical protein